MGSYMVNCMDEWWTKLLPKDVHQDLSKTPVASIAWSLFVHEFFAPNELSICLASANNSTQNFKVKPNVTSVTHRFRKRTTRSLAVRARECCMARPVRATGLRTIAI